MHEISEGLYGDQWSTVRHYAEDLPERPQWYLINACERRLSEELDSSDRWVLTGLTEHWLTSSGGPFSNDEEFDDDSTDWHLRFVLTMAELALERRVATLRDSPSVRPDLEAAQEALVEETFGWVWTQLAVAAGEPGSLGPVMEIVATGPRVHLAELVLQARRVRQ